MTLLAQQVGPYRIVGRLGAGGMGEVFLAEDTRLGRRVALKTLAGSGARPGEARRKVLREARAAAHLNHPNIAAVYDVIDSGEDAHIVMEYVDGETLAARVQQGPLPVPLAVDIGVQLAEALVEAHGAGIVHRDLKPANICITGGGRVKVLDFGLAQGQPVDLSSATGPLDTVSTEKPIVGTPQYIPPEHLMGGVPDARGDIYSVGVTLYELLAGVRPFGGADLVSLVSEVLHAETPHVRSRRPDVSEHLDAVVFRAMARRPADRFENAQQLLDELRKVAQEITRPAVPSVVVRAPTGPIPTRSWVIGAIGVALVAAAAGGAWWASTRVAPAPSTPVVVAVLPFSAGAAGLDGDTLGAGVSDVLTTTLARVSGISVIARAAMAEEPHATVATARKLGATHVVDGRVQSAGDRVRLSAQLVNTANSAVVWAGTYEGNAKDVLDLERGLADELLRAIAPGTRAPDRVPTADREAFADYAQGWSFLDRPDIPENAARAADAFRRAIARDPRFARAQAGLGLALLRRWERERRSSLAEDARSALTEALRLDPSDASVRVALATAYTSSGRPDEALDELDRALAQHPQLDEALALRGELLAQKGRVDEGVAALRDAIRLRPNHWRHHLRLGTALFTASRYADAIPAFRRATELQPDAPWGFQMLGTTQHMLGNLDEAITAYKQALAVGADEKAWDNLGTAYYQLARWSEALQAYEASLRVNPHSPVAWHNVGDLQRRLGHPAESRRAWEQALDEVQQEIARLPQDASRRVLAGLLNAKLGRFAQALALADDAVRQAPAQGDVLHLAATTHAIAGDEGGAFHLAERAVAVGYSRVALRDDEFLEPLRRDRRFAALMTDSTKGDRP